MYFHPLDTQLSAPRRMNDPFHYTPDPLCLLAAEVVQRQLPAHPAEGKMVGVLLVEHEGPVGLPPGLLGQTDWALPFGRVCSSRLRLPPPRRLLQATRGGNRAGQPSACYSTGQSSLPAPAARADETGARLRDDARRPARKGQRSQSPPRPAAQRGPHFGARTGSDGARKPVSQRTDTTTEGAPPRDATTAGGRPTLFRSGAGLPECKPQTDERRTASMALRTV